MIGGGLAHGLWTHRWAPWGGPAARAQSARLEHLPLDIGGWTGQRIETDPIGLPKEVTGRGVTTRYADPRDGSVVYAYVACGPTEAAVVHVPTVCYPANGYDACAPDLLVGLGPDPARGQFRLSEFKRDAGGVTSRPRVSWAWSDGRG